MNVPLIYPGSFQETNLRGYVAQEVDQSICWVKKNGKTFGLCSLLGFNVNFEFREIGRVCGAINFAFGAGEL